MPTTTLPLPSPSTTYGVFHRAWYRKFEARAGAWSLYRDGFATEAEAKKHLAAARVSSVHGAVEIRRIGPEAVR